jgi:hypothetical protein
VAVEESAELGSGWVHGCGGEAEAMWVGYIDPPSGLWGIVSGGEARDGGERTLFQSLLTRFPRCIVLSMCSNSREKLEIDLLHVRGSEAYNEPFENC